MKVRSPRISDGYEESGASLPSTNRSVHLAAFVHDSDVAVFLPRNVTMSDDLKEDNLTADDEMEVDKVDKVDKLGNEEWISQAWRFLAQPFTWLAMLSR